MFLVAPVAASTLLQLIHRGWRRAVNQQSPNVEVFKNTPNQPKTTGDRSEMLGNRREGVMVLVVPCRQRQQFPGVLGSAPGLGPRTRSQVHLTLSHPPEVCRAWRGFPLSPPKISRVWGARGSSDPKRAKLWPLSELSLAYSGVPNLPSPNSCGNQGEVRDGNIPVSQR